MKLSFSTLACPDWTMPEIISIASASGYDGIELRFVEGEDSIWKLPAFQGSGLALTRRSMSNHGLAISCVDTSCRFHFPDVNQRNRWLEEGERMADLAAALEAPGIRVFGDTVQSGADRACTRAWIADSICQLSQKIASTGVAVWLETHGDFANARETLEILSQSSSPTAGVVWDPANCFLEAREKPSDGAARLRGSICHVHLKDLLNKDDQWSLILSGDGNFPLAEVVSALRQLNYNRFLSFEWEKKWHPEIPDATIALPHFTRWFREKFES